MVIHLVLYEPNDGLSSDEMASFRAVLAAAVTEIPVIRNVRVGRTVDLGIGYEDRSTGQSFGYAAIFEFDSVRDLKAYMSHPAHTALAEQFWKYCKRTMILDLEAEDPRATRLSVSEKKE